MGVQVEVICSPYFFFKVVGGGGGGVRENNLGNIKKAFSTYMCGT